MILLRKIYPLLFLAVLWSCVARAQPDSIPVNNDNALLLHSKMLNEPRSIWVHLPAAYNSTKKPYPVLYLLDGEGHFKYVSGLVDYLSGYDRNRIPEMIVIAIPNIDRGRDLTPVQLFNGKTDRTGTSNTDGGHQFLQFIQNELIPYVDTNYRTAPYRILAGHSLAGLFSLYTKVTNPDLFNATILMSPAIGMDGGNTKILDDFKSFLKSHQDLSDKFFISIGNENTRAVDSIVEQLRMFAPESMDWEFKKYEAENHFSVTYKSMFDALKFICKNWFIDNYATANMTYDEIRSHFDKLSEEFGYTMVPREDFMNNYGYKQLRSNNIDAAIEIFKQNIKNYPGSWNAYDSMGEAYMKKGKRQLAIDHYEKSISLNPDNKGGKEMLKKLKANSQD
ncbi:alpha/beta hydrolase-fold protein [Sinomicrobium weinanense]|uniref:Tetratricopeptide repeat protein n=1 Tax=Sinomicrobium weinanense TaxID=2842200 RepID=A0A926JUH3_9FLAO|nr:alpha/beta hydrolase-fold protein [Sinomicrobium weinanense]MBC9797773.1 tetratricopeptide repeat protein [Sinomicrobium weinanense]MBU3122408.1 tetratricopeptide repeat protein [Sinomicrobium weinanense]